MCFSKVHFFHSDESIYVSDDSPFYNPSAYETVRFIEKNFDIISSELHDYVNGKQIIDVTNPNAPYNNIVNTWKHVYFSNYMLLYKSGIENFPKTAAILLSQPDVTLCGIATLKAGGRLMPHCGETNAIIRCHIGLKVPDQLPKCGIRVKDEERSWEVGNALAFNDAFNHEAWNFTQQDRYVLIFDIIKPELRPYKKLICAYCLGIASLRLVLGKIGLYHSCPIWLRKILAFPLSAVGYIAISINNAIRKRTLLKQ